MSFTELVVLYYHILHVNNQYKTSVRDMKILTVFLLSNIEKFFDQLETKMTNIDPSIVGQHVQTLKNDYFKAWLYAFWKYWLLLQHFFCWNTTEKRKLEKYFFSARVFMPKLVCQPPKWHEYVTAKSSKKLLVKNLWNISQIYVRSVDIM